MGTLAEFPCWPHLDKFPLIEKAKVGFEMAPRIQLIQELGKPKKNLLNIPAFSISSFTIIAADEVGGERTI